MIGSLVIDRSLEIDATLDSLRPVGQWLKDAAREGGLAHEVSFGLDLAVHEAVANIVQHGCRDSGCHRIDLRIRVDERRVKVDIEDDAIPFDPLSVAPPPAPRRLEDVIPGGRGVLLMRQFTDEIRYRRENGRNVLTLVRFLTPHSQRA